MTIKIFHTKIIHKGKLLVAILPFNVRETYSQINGPITLNGTLNGVPFCGQALSTNKKDYYLFINLALREKLHIDRLPFPVELSLQQPVSKTNSSEGSLLT